MTDYKGHTIVEREPSTDSPLMYEESNPHPEVVFTITEHDAIQYGSLAMAERITDFCIEGRNPHRGCPVRSMGDMFDG